MSELPTPAGLGEGHDKAFDGGIKVAALKFEEREYPPHLVEFGKKGNQLIFHIFKDGVFPMSFRGRIYGSFTRRLNFNGRESELLDIDWVQEFNSWCVIIKDVLQVSPPPSDELIEEILEGIFT
jgi:hypothetical protein